MAFQTDISSADAFKREVLEVPGTCQIVEAYNQWAGPCKVGVAGAQGCPDAWHPYVRPRPLCQPSLHRLQLPNALIQ